MVFLVLDDPAGAGRPGFATWPTITIPVWSAAWPEEKILPLNKPICMAQSGNPFRKSFTAQTTTLEKTVTAARGC
jgi:hypothetical protein